MEFEQVASASLPEIAQRVQAELKEKLQDFQVDTAQMQTLRADRFQAALLEPTVATSVNGTLLYIPPVILREIPYFSAMLEGKWTDAGTPKIELPCHVSEFLLILKRLSTNMPLGCDPLHVPDCASALRICSAAGMLLIDERIPELARVLDTSVRSQEDVAMLGDAEHSLPAAICNNIHNKVTRSVAISDQHFLDMITSASTEQAYDSVSAILAFRRGSLNSETIARAARLVLESAATPHRRSVDRIAWAARISRDFLTCEAATSVFAHAIEPISDIFSDRHEQGCFHWGEIPDATKAAWHDAFISHLQRCAESDCLAKGIALMPAAERNLLDNRRSRCCGACACHGRMNWGNFFRLGKQHAKDLATAVRRSSSGRDRFVAELARLTPPLLVELLSDELVAVLGSDVHIVISRIAREPESVLGWITRARLASMPLSSRRNLCVSLLKHLNVVEPEIAVAVVEVLK